MADWCPAVTGMLTTLAASHGRSKTGRSDRRPLYHGLGPLGLAALSYPALAILSTFDAGHYVCLYAPAIYAGG